MAHQDKKISFRLAGSNASHGDYWHCM